jgi:hypothetical protein
MHYGSSKVLYASALKKLLNYYFVSDKRIASQMLLLFSIDTWMHAAHSVALISEMGSRNTEAADRHR